jgi:preprotein translocase subunit SecG
VRRPAGWRRCSFGRRALEALEVREPELDERPDALLEPRLAGDSERLLVAFARFCGGDALLEPVVAGHEQLLDPRARVLLPLHGRSVTPTGRWYPVAAMVQVVAVFQVLVSALLLTLILMHSGRDTGMGGMGFTPASQGGTHIVERNLTRLTVVVATVFFVNTIVLYRLLA